MPRPLSTKAPAAVTSERRAPAAGANNALFRQVMGSFATGITIVTTATDGQPHGMTANAFMAGSLEPPLCVISVAREARLHDRLRQSGCFGVSVLGREQSHWSNHFAGRGSPGLEPEFRYLGRVPVLARALSVIAADVVDHVACGDHALFIGHITEMETTRASPLLYFRGRYAWFDPTGPDEDAAPLAFW